jgi:hypothetical protein
MPDTEGRTFEPGERPRRAVPRVAWYTGAIVLAVTGSLAFASLAAGDRSQTGAKASCPSKVAGLTVDWVEFVRFGGRTYQALSNTKSRTIDPSQRGQGLGKITCALSHNSDPNRESKDLPDGTAAFLPLGTALYEIRGYTVSCRIAAENGGKLVVYLAQHEVNRRPTPVCGNDHSPPP